MHDRDERFAVLESRNAECKCRIGDAQPTSEHLELLELPTAHGADQHQLTSATKAWSRLETERTPFLDFGRQPPSCFRMLRASKAYERARAGVERTYNEDAAAERPKECTRDRSGSVGLGWVCCLEAAPAPWVWVWLVWLIPLGWVWLVSPIPWVGSACVDPVCVACFELELR